MDASTERQPLTLGGGPVNVVVTLTQPSVAVAAEQQDLNTRQQRSYANRLEAQQAVVSKRLKAVGGRELARVTAALNAIVLRIDASKIKRLKLVKGVSRVRPINDYALDLSETVPYIGAAAAQAGGVDGTGIDIAIIDSGIDYTHRSFGGPGTVADYQAAYGTTTADPKNKTRDGLFPTAKVVQGWDFVGETWPTNPVLAPDEDPIDCGPQTIAPPCAGGHGSHVADITAGINPAAKGVAPGAKLYAYKACSAISTACSGVAMLQAVNAALDPNGDGSTADRVDVMNLSIGSAYGQVEDDISLAYTNASRLGTVVVGSAGNSADRPYITGSGATSPDAISVAQTQVPSAKLYLIDPSAAGFRSVGGSRQPWSAAPTLVTGPLAYNAASLAKKQGCSNAAGANPYAAGEHAGQILIVDRGTCAVSFKSANAAAAGAIAVVVVNNLLQAPGDLPPDFSFGGGAQTIAAYTITLRDGNHLKGLAETTACPAAGCPNPVAPNALGAPATIDPATAANLVGNMVSSSSRGPSHSFVAIKPDIGAPGASLSAEAGTGTGGTAFGGTSGAAPMVAGSAALLLDKNPGLSVGEVKALLMNTAETTIGLNPVGLPGVLAPVTRIGGGEVRVAKALASGTAAWSATDVGASLSFGYHAVAWKEKLEKAVTVKNYTNTGRWYEITPSFRFADDAASGAVKVDTPSGIWVPAGKTRKFEVELRIDPSKLPIWAASGLNGGTTGGDGYRLQSLEFDGYISIDGGTNNAVHVAWHVLPHRAADIDAHDSFRLKKDGTASVKVENDSKVLDGRYDLFALTGTSPRSATPIPGAGANFALIDLRAVGVRPIELDATPGADAVQFGIDTFGSRSHPVYPAEFDVLIDNNRDGVVDRILFTAENGAFGSSGQTVTFVFTCTNATCSTGTTAAFFFLDAELNSGNAILTAPLSALGLTPTTKFDFAVEAYDNYFTGALTDSIDTMTHTLATPKFTGSGLPATIPAKGKAKLNVASVAGGDLASPSQTGFLLLYRDAEGVTRANSRNEADTIEVKTKKHGNDD